MSHARWLVKFAAAVAGVVPTVALHAQSPAPAVPTTRILAIGTLVPDADMQRVRAILPTEVRATARLYLDGKIDQWYSLKDRNGVAFILNVTDLADAKAMLEALPLGRAHLMTFSLEPLGPLNPLRQLLGSVPPPGAAAPE
ncbi:MAG TPA: hypothetical protein VMB48_02070 [Steroidobacteraceae bacterium]|nr:hypothetical protein [Steroidobacteraceae bacterium]